MPRQPSAQNLVDQPRLFPASRRGWLTWAGTSAMASLLPGCGGSSTASPTLTTTIAWGRKEIREAMQSSKMRAASVALLHNDHIVWQEAFGALDANATTPATPDTRFNATLNKPSKFPARTRKTPFFGFCGLLRRPFGPFAGP